MSKACRHCGITKPLEEFCASKRMVGGRSNKCLECRRGGPRKKRIDGTGYTANGYKGHQINGVRKFDHVRMVEAVLGHELRGEECVHHINEDRGDNRNDNFVLCPDRAYHNLIHARMDAFAACGNYEWRKCRRCGKYDNRANMKEWPNGPTITRGHPECERQYQMDVYRRKKACHVS